MYETELELKSNKRENKLTLALLKQNENGSGIVFTCNTISLTMCNKTLLL